MAMVLLNVNACHLPLAVLVHVSVRLYRVFLDKELNALVEGCGDRWRLLPEQHLHRVIAREAHDVVRAVLVGAALAI